MKKRILLAIAGLVAVSLVVFGPTLLNLYRLQQFVSASEDAYRADGGPWPHQTDTCLGCHGVKGTSVDQGYPSLAGQPASYVAAQLHDFASGKRANPNMAPLAMSLSEAEIKSLSEYYARQPARGNRYFEADPQQAAQGRQLVEKGACAACHGARLMGQAQFPRLAGQGHDYLLKQLEAFAAGTRTEATGTMQRVAAALSPKDREAVAQYLASLNPEKE
ncbi:cytochrome C [Burkholderia stabilis]|uniref:c-type cytochrome n=1 Tax=Burkholderia stabilis TaxID=95485 RepID=UPI000851DF5E|nr:c-type cytochrome [Burkholderia stabilis]AOR72806.1 cytochrome C [Burkholderia stabilis]HDR9492332.1 cytochrome c4 [Burkholderia stabilis]HDR9496480.1 cytochrome c4 [Burkholderia stabilis]HDR9522874.1 cytochrome c4 [Burkholderia stabilis]HDR9528365.1 cytochrome c4 [Burkholderia stabilis]